MPNPYDQFDAPPAANPYDQFDQPAYKGSILPFSQDAAGNNRFDLSAGFPGAIMDAVRLPGDVVSGKQPVIGPDAQVDPGLMQRSINLAGTIAPSSPVMTSARAVAANGLVPTAQQLKAAAGAGYDAARNAGLDISGDAVGEMARGLQSSLTSDHGIIAKTAPKTFGILDELASPPSDGFATVSGLDAARRGLSSVSMEGGTEGLAARNAVRRVDDFMSSLDSNSLAPSNTGAATPQAVAQLLGDARGNYAAAQRSNSLTGDLDSANTGILERAEARAEASHSGRNLDNSIRSRVASFIQDPQNLAGFSQPEIDALKGVVSGGPVRNTARFVSNILGGGGGLAHGLTAGLGAAIGGHLGGMEGAGIGAAVPGVLGGTLKGVENSLASRSLNRADDMVRMNSPLYRAQQAAQPNYALSLSPQQLAVRTLLPGLLSYFQNGPPPPAMPQGPGLLPGA